MQYGQRITGYALGDRQATRHNQTVLPGSGSAASIAESTEITGIGVLDGLPDSDQGTIRPWRDPLEGESVAFGGIEQPLGREIWTVNTGHGDPRSGTELVEPGDDVFGAQR
jgi:hypothetical protein